MKMNLIWITKLIKISKKNFFLTILFSLGTSLDGILLPIAIGMLTDALTKKSAREAITICLAFLVGMMFVSFSAMMWKYYGYKLRQDVNLYLKTQVFEDALDDQDDIAAPSQYVSKIFNDLKQIETQVIDGITLFAYCVLQAIVTAFFLLVVNWRVSAIFLILSLLPSLVPKLFKNRLTKLANNWSANNSVYTKKLEEGLQARKLFFRYDSRTEEKKSLFRQLMNAEVSYFKMNFGQQISTFSINSVYNFSMITSLIIGAIFVLQGNLTVGSLIAIFMAADRFASPAVTTVSLYNQITMYAPIVANLLQETTPQHAEKIEESVVSNSNNVVELDNVHFEFGEKVIVDKLSAVFKNKSKTLIVGESGSGKSTLMKLIIRELNPTSGLVKSLQKQQLENKFAIISQDPFIFDDSIQFNLTLGKQIPTEVLDDSLIKVGLPEWTSEHEMFYQPLGTVGEHISGGQKRRLELARALVHGMNNIFVDEGLASLDEISSRKIHQLIIDFPGTVIDIEHRFPKDLMNDYDQIIVLGGGNADIFASGEYNKLASNPLFI